MLYNLNENFCGDFNISEINLLIDPLIILQQNIVEKITHQQMEFSYNCSIIIRVCIQI